MAQMIGFKDPRGLELISITSEDGNYGVDIINDNGEYHVRIAGNSHTTFITNDRKYAINWAEGYCTLL